MSKWGHILRYQGWGFQHIFGVVTWHNPTHNLHLDWTQGPYLNGESLQDLTTVHLNRSQPHGPLYTPWVCGPLRCLFHNWPPVLGRHLPRVCPWLTPSYCNRVIPHVSPLCVCKAGTASGEPPQKEEHATSPWSKSEALEGTHKAPWSKGILTTCSL